MKLTKWKETAELVGLAAIVLSLIFVGIETRNGARQAELNTRALELGAYQQLIESISAMNTLDIENPELAVAMAKAWELPDELTDRERRLVFSMFWLRLRHGDMAYFQFERGAIDETRLRSALSPLLDTMRMPYGKEFWERFQGNFVPAYREYIDRLLETSEGE